MPHTRKALMTQSDGRRSFVGAVSQASGAVTSALEISFKSPFVSTKRAARRSTRERGGSSATK